MASRRPPWQVQHHRMTVPTQDTSHGVRHHWDPPSDPDPNNLFGEGPVRMSSDHGQRVHHPTISDLSRPLQEVQHNAYVEVPAAQRARAKTEEREHPRQARKRIREQYLLEHNEAASSQSKRPRTESHQWPSPSQNQLVAIPQTPTNPRSAPSNDAKPPPEARVEQQIERLPADYPYPQRGWHRRALAEYGPGAIPFRPVGAAWIIHPREIATAGTGEGRFSPQLLPSSWVPVPALENDEHGFYFMESRNKTLFYNLEDSEFRRLSRCHHCEMNLLICDDNAPCSSCLAAGRDKSQCIAIDILVNPSPIHGHATQRIEVPTNPQSQDSEHIETSSSPPQELKRNPSVATDSPAQPTSTQPKKPYRTHKGIKGAPPETADIVKVALAVDRDLSPEEILTFFPTHLSKWIDLCAFFQATKHGWSQMYLAAYINWARSLKGDDAVLPNTLGCVRRAKDIMKARRQQGLSEIVEDPEKWDAPKRRQTHRDPHQDLPKSLFDMSLRHLAIGVTQMPQGRGRRVLTRAVQYAVEHPELELKFDDIRALSEKFGWKEEVGERPKDAFERALDENQETLVKYHDFLKQYAKSHGRNYQ